MLDFQTYEDFTKTTAIYPSDPFIALSYLSLGLCGESGEYAEKVKKFIRDGVFDRTLAAKELGDVLWYVTQSAIQLGFTLEDIAWININKLKERQLNNKLQGEGDER
jgi:NTP pyrophosphatase (non-canonical NTP hydrolase)